MDVTCGACGQANEAGRKFCGECGAPLSRPCGSCGTPNAAGTKFCGECGAPLAEPAPRAAAQGPHAERRLVSVLFADLVGFTAASEGRDAEDTRELLTRYFELARSTIERYGGTVEKFIGDAVMAVWGAPVAREDDAERAVRAALELLDAIPTLDGGLQARAGVLTGEAAVTLGATDQGMVAGDLVNTASRIQSAAEPGTVLVGETTKRVTEAAVAYANAGTHDLKGKSESVPLYRAERAASRPHDEDRAGGLEAPFVGRRGELRLLKDLFHATADEARARLVSVVGVAGIGKSRLSREFERHVEGLATRVWWHRGRCLSYGDGVAYWALAEMVRARCGIPEDEEHAGAVARLRSTVQEHVPDPAERAWIEPRLLHLLGLTDRTAPDREDVFAAWRRFFERLAEEGPLVMVFEDFHWADEGLVAFVDYLLDWARHHPIFVLTLSRPELADRHPGFPGSMRSATTLPLEPLDDESMDQLLTGLVPGLPEDVRARLREAADGVPLYAVETVRMLRDRGILTDDVATDDLARLEVPETLHALIASRLDALPADERRLLQDGAVLGKTFTLRGLAALSGLTDDEVRPLVDDLVRKELLAVETDPFSAEQGQLGFLQALVQRVAYETIARRERRRRHVAAARFLASDAGTDPDEIAEVIATHYLDAYEADPEADDRDDVRAEARTWFTRAAERAASLAASLEAQRAYERAADLTGDDVERGRALARAGELAVMGGRTADAESLLEQAIPILEAADLRSETAAAQVRLADVMFVTNRGDEAIASLAGALAAHEAEGDDVAVATVSAELSRALYFEGRAEGALEYAERALDLAERMRLDHVVVQALMNKALALESHPNERIGLVRQALVLAEESEDDRGALRACMNLSYLLSLSGRSDEAVEVVERGIALARRRGERVWERNLMTNLVCELVRQGAWDDAEQTFSEARESSFAADVVHAAGWLDIAAVALYRGDHERVLELIRPLAVEPESANIQQRHNAVHARMLVASAEGRHADVVAECLHWLRDTEISSDPMAVEDLTEIGSEAAMAAGPPDALGEIVALARAAPTIHVPAERKLLLHEARIAALEGASEPRWDEAVAELRAGEPFWLATALLEQAEWLAANDRVEEAALFVRDAQEIFEGLRAQPRLERLERLRAALDTRREAAPASA